MRIRSFAPQLALHFSRGEQKVTEQSEKKTNETWPVINPSGYPGPQGIGEVLGFLGFCVLTGVVGGSAAKYGPVVQQYIAALWN